LPPNGMKTGAAGARWLKVDAYVINTLAKLAP